MKKALVALLMASGLGAIAVSAHADHWLPPPPVRYEPAPAPLPPSYFWREGHWRWDGDRYVWVEGNWVRRDDPIARLWDRDLDGVPNAYDRDADGDGVPNRFDRFPYDPRRS